MKKTKLADRIVNSIEGKKFDNCLIIDFGTATTFDIIKGGTYEGGVIAPGVKLSIKNLSHSTALLPTFDLKNNQKSYGKTTKDALNAGFIWGYEGLINKNIFEIHFPKSLSLILKLLSFLPSKMYFGLVGKMTKYQKKN